MTTLAPALIAIGGIEEVTVAAWSGRILHIVRRGPDLFLHYEGDATSVQRILPTGFTPKLGITSAVLDDDLFLAWSEISGDIHVMAWNLRTKTITLPPVFVTQGESPTLVIFRTRKIALAYTRGNNNYRRNSSTRGVTWGVEITEDVGAGPLRELDATIRDTTGFLAQWVETDAVIVPEELHFYSMNAADISGTVLDDLKNNQNGTLVGGVSTVPGYDGEALSFDGVNDEVNLDGIQLATSASWTISAIIRYASLPGTQKSILNTRAAANQQPMALLIGPNGVTFEIQAQTSITHVGIVIPPVSYFNNRWNKVQLVYDHTRRLMRSYLDGKLSSERGVTSANVTSAQFRIGSSPSVGGLFFTGLVDTVRVWNVALTDKQIAAL